MHSGLTYQLGISRSNDIHREAAALRLANQALNRPRLRVRRRWLPRLSVGLRPGERLA